MAGDMLSQEEIDALLRGDSNTEQSVDQLTDIEKDALGEIGNISMGTAATTLFTLLGQKVVITTPKVSITSREELASQYPVPFVAVDVKYKIGIEGANLLILRTDDVKIITDLMMGGDGTNIDRELNEMDLSAISEAMNQMVGSSATSLSEMFSNKIDIEPPRAFEINFQDVRFDYDILNNDPLVKISFKMVIGTLIDSEIMQLLPLSFAKNMVEELLNGGQSKKKQENNKDDMNNDANIRLDNHIEEKRTNSSYAKANDTSNSHINNNYDDKQNNSNIKQNPVNVKKAEFEAFEITENKAYNENIDIIQEIPIEITVELGRTSRKISEILEYGPGTIIELDKLVGEPLEIFANGKFIAKGEVVVIDDNFGMRITDIVNPSKRISK